MTNYDKAKQMLEGIEYDDMDLEDVAIALNSDEPDGAIAIINQLLDEKLMRLLIEE